jgi:hypothetical protein
VGGIKEKPETSNGDVLFSMREEDWNGAYLNENRIFLINIANDEIIVGYTYWKLILWIVLRFIYFWIEK